MNAARKILIVRLSSLGDILHAIPALNSLRGAFPRAEIDWLVEKRTAALLSAVPGIDNIFVIDLGILKSNSWKADSWHGVLRVIRSLRARRYDMCFDFQGLIKTAFLTFLSGGRERFGFSAGLAREWPAHWFYQRKLEPLPHPVHIVAQNLLLARLGGGIETGRALDLKVPAEDVRRVEILLQNLKLREFVIINPGGGWPTKRWSPGKYGALAERIQSELQLRVVITTGPGEESLFVSLAQNCARQAPIHVQLPFLQLIPLFRKASLFIGGDTGPFHLACALGRPVVGIFGPTSPLRNGPWHDADESVARTLPCSYCGGRSCSRRMECMEISVDEVFSSVIKRLETSFWKRADR